MHRPQGPGEESGNRLLSLPAVHDAAYPKVVFPADLRPRNEDLEVPRRVALAAAAGGHREPEDLVGVERHPVEAVAPAAVVAGQFPALRGDGAEELVLQPLADGEGQI